MPKQQLDRRAEALSAQVRRNIQRSTNYVLGVVLFAVALFAGMSTKLATPAQRNVLLLVGWVVFGAAAIWIATSGEHLRLATVHAARSPAPTIAPRIRSAPARGRGCRERLSGCRARPTA
jgi:hypothetical protein